jgi:hypothetical protein
MKTHADDVRLTQDDLKVARLGAPRHPSPLKLSTRTGDFVPDYVPDHARVLAEVEVDEGERPPRWPS